MQTNLFTAFLAAVSDRMLDAFGTKHQYELDWRGDTLFPQKTEEWWTARDGTYHRLGGPALILRDPFSGKPLLEEWYRFGKLHRTDGPASILRDRQGNVITLKWRLDGKEITPVSHELG